jgi:hypothetical protein
MRFLSVSFGRRAVAALLVAALSPLAACSSLGDTSPCDAPPPQTEHFVITEARAATLVAAAAGTGLGPQCYEDCAAMPHTAAGAVLSCGIGAPTDGGVGLTCMYGWACR